jgi:phosphatidylglycerol:prolipoprotein diacylglycerol transferase
MYAAAMLAALLFLRYGSRGVRGLVSSHALGGGLWAMAGALAGARIFHLAQHLGETFADPSRLLDLSGATVSWGAYLGGAAGFWLYCRVHRLAASPYLDLAAPAAGLAIFVGRWACFLNGDDFGTQSDVPWALRFPHASYPFAQQARANLISPLDDLSLPVHPVQLYLSAAGLALFFLTLAFWKRLRNRPGAAFCFFWTGHSVLRFALESFRADHEHFVFGMPQAQVLCLLTGAAAASGLWYTAGRRPVRAACPAPAV